MEKGRVRESARVESVWAAKCLRMPVERQHQQRQSLGDEKLVGAVWIGVK